jgi:hypothetical protein
VTAYLRAACRLLGAESVTATGLAPSLGTVVEDMGRGLPLIFTPGEAAFAEGQVVRKWKTDEVNHVQLVLAVEQTLEALAVFGDWSPVSSLHGPPQVSCAVAQPELARDCTLIADLAPNSTRVTAIVVRPDVR